MRTSPFTRIYRLSALLSSMLLLNACGTGGSSPVYVPYNPVTLQQPQQLCIFYGQPDSINGTQPTYLRDETGTIYDINITSAGNEFAKCALVVLGDGLQNPSHPAHYNTQLIMYTMAERSIPIFGYVDAGVITQNLSLTEADSRISQWQAMGVDGIFLDDFGFDYGTERNRQNALVNLVHNKNLRAFVNAYNPDDVFGNNNEKGQNEPPSIAADDLYLAENWLYESGQATDIHLWYSKSLKLESYLNTYNVRLAATATRAALQATAYNHTTPEFSYAYWGSVMQKAEFFQWTDEGFSSTNSTLYTHPLPSTPAEQNFTSNITPVMTSNRITGYTRSLTKGKITISNDQGQLSASVINQ